MRRTRRWSLNNVSKGTICNMSLTQDNFLQRRETDVGEFLEKNYFLIIFIFYLVLKNIFYNDFIFSYLVYKIKY